MSIAVETLKDNFKESKVKEAQVARVCELEPFHWEEFPKFQLFSGKPVNPYCYCRMTIDVALLL